MRLPVSQPRVLVVCHRLDPGGTEMHLSRVLPKLRRLGVDVSVFVLARGGKLETPLRENGVPVSGPRDLGQRWLQGLSAGLALRRELRRLRPGIVHFFLTAPYLVGSLASLGAGRTVRIMSRRSLANYQRNHAVLARLERRLHRFTHVLLGNSTAVVEELVAECGDREKVGLIHNGVELPPAVTADTRAALRRELGIADDAFVLAVSANFIAYKGHADLFEALARTPQLAPCRLILLGRDLGARADLRAQADALGIGGNIVWIEDRVDVQPLMQAADVAVVPSHEEGFSNSLIEAMAYGLPVVATRVGGNRDAIVDGESGVLVRPRDPAALAQALGALRADAALRQRLGAAARGRVERHFSLESCVQRYLKLYTHVAAGHLRVQDMVDNPQVAEP